MDNVEVPAPPGGARRPRQAEGEAIRFRLVMVRPRAPMVASYGEPEEKDFYDLWKVEIYQNGEVRAYSNSALSPYPLGSGYLLQMHYGGEWVKVPHSLLTVNSIGVTGGLDKL